VIGSAQTLRDAAAKRGILIGAAGQPQALSEAGYASTLAGEFNLLEAENVMKFEVIHPSQTGYDFGLGDKLTSFAETNRMKMRGHTLVWHSQVAKWVEDANFTTSQLSAILQDHITQVMKHYAGKVFAWDVVNEAIADDGSGLRDSVWYNQPGIGLAGTGYVEQAFRWARAADPKALLFYNEYDAEFPGPKVERVYSMLKDFRARGVPVDGIGLQLHLKTLNAQQVSDMAAIFKRFADLGLEIHITELDVRLPFTAHASVRSADLAAQAVTYGEVARVCVTTPQCKAIQLWGFTDKYSWIPRFFPGYGAALIFDASYAKKPAYTALLEALK
jgi:endo-1,4-beta-xylanase